MKQIRDPVHGYVELDEVAVAIVDTSQFQRLRDISQLGSTQFLYNGGHGRRFEHSLGVGHLGKKKTNNSSKTISAYLFFVVFSTNVRQSLAATATRAWDYRSRRALRTLGRVGARSR